MEAVVRWELASGSAASEESVAVPARAAAEPHARLDVKCGQCHVSCARSSPAPVV